MSNKLNGDLKERVNHLFERFIKIHNTEAVNLAAKSWKGVYFLEEVFNFFNAHITWSSTKEGYVYYYTLNLRWVLILAYLCYEEFQEYKHIAHSYLVKFVSYSSSSFRSYERDIYKQKNIFFHKKIKKIEKIFGN